MMTLLFILMGVICFVVWPWVYLLHFRSAETVVLKHNAVLFGPATILMLVYFYYLTQQTEIRSQARGAIVAYQLYMSSGNKNKRKPFERVEILVKHSKQIRHLRIDEDLKKLPSGAKACFEYYDRKLNPHMQDSILIQWLN